MLELTNKNIQVARLTLPKTPDKASWAVKFCDKPIKAVATIPLIMIMGSEKQEMINSN